MARSKDFHSGWNKQRIAGLLLSKFSFIAEPATSGDDIGADFFCTIHHTITRAGKHRDYEFLEPDSSFAIQIKSNDDSFEVAYCKYLENLEIPFFVGVANQEDHSLTIYSGEYIPSLYSLKGCPDELTIQLCDTITDREFFTQPDPAKAHYELMCPKVTHLALALSPKELEARVDIIRDRCKYILRNLAAKISHEYTFFYPDHSEAFAGVGSAQHFRRNFEIRLNEVCHNLRWIYYNRRDEFSRDEFQMYYSFLRQMQSQYDHIPRELVDNFESLQREIRANDFVDSIPPPPSPRHGASTSLLPTNTTATEITPISDLEAGGSVVSWTANEDNDQ